MSAATPAAELAAAVAALRSTDPAPVAAPRAVALRRSLPSVAAPLADWLESEAEQLENDDFPGIHAHALAVARALIAGPFS